MSRTDKKTLAQIKDETPDWITVNATIWQMKVDNFSYNFCYTACPIMVADRKCMKKVVNNGDGKWQCDKCDQTVDECDYRYILQVQIQDHTGHVWATAFQETGEEIMGVSAKDLYLIKHEEQDNDKFTEIVCNALFNKFSFTLKVKEESYGDDQRTVKSNIVKAQKIKFSTNTKALLHEIEKIHKKEDPSSVTMNHELNHQTDTVGQQTDVDGGNSGASSRCFWCRMLGLDANTGMPASRVCHYESQYGGSVGRMNSGVSSGGGNSGVSDECFTYHKLGLDPKTGMPVNRGECHQLGHWARGCPNLSNLASYGGY